MIMQNKTCQCQNCKNDFTIEPEDFNFYQKIKVPPPTFCPECRTIRRLAFRNERSLYKRKNNAPGKNEEILSMYAPDSPYIVYDKEYWWSDKWNPLDFGVDYDPARPFFEQFGELWQRVPLTPMQQMNVTDSPYVNYVADLKNCYLVFGTGFSENIRYCNRVHFSKDSQDMLVSSHNELCHDLLDCHGCFHLISSEECISCLDSYFLYNCRNCNNCFACSNLVNKSYCFFNEQLLKDEYLKKISNLSLSNYTNYLSIKLKYENEIKNKAIRKFANIIHSQNCTGHNINKSKNCRTSFDIAENAENSKFLVHTLDVKENYDAYGNYRSELFYESVDNNFGMNNIGVITVYNSSDCSYCFTCQASSNLFGCIGLRSKEYCILNKEYSKEEYGKMRKEIVKQMSENPYTDTKGRTHIYGDFFPMEISPWAYNETIAQEYFPLSKEEALGRGYKWREKEKRNYEIDIKNEDLPKDMKDAKDDIINKVIECAHHGDCNEQCTEAFRIIPDELAFYRKLDLPIPRLCPNCRHYERLAKRNPMKLWHRKCMCEKENHGHSGRCKAEFETSYAPERPEIVYCESCYQKEVY